MNYFTVTGYSDLHNKEYQKHLKAVKFCLENGLSFPKETSEFFKGKVDGNDLEDIKPQYILKYIENGVAIDMEVIPLSDNRIEINVNEIPDYIDTIIIRYDTLENLPRNSKYHLMGRNV